MAGGRSSFDASRRAVAGCMEGCVPSGRTLEERGCPLIEQRECQQRFARKWPEFARVCRSGGCLCHTPERLCCTVGNKRPTGVDTRPGPRPRRRSSSASHASVPRWRSVQYARVHVPTRAQRYVAAHRQRSEFRTWNVERLICRTAGRPGRPPCRRGCSRRRGSGRGAPLLPAWRSAWRCRTGSGRRRSAPGSSPGSGRSAPD